MYINITIFSTQDLCFTREKSPLTIWLTIWLFSLNSYCHIPDLCDFSTTKLVLRWTCQVRCYFCRRKTGKDRICAALVIDAIWSWLLGWFKIPHCLMCVLIVAQTHTGFFFFSPFSLMWRTSEPFWEGPNMMTSTQRICLWGTVLLSSLDNSTLLTMETSTQPTNWAARKRGGSLIIITLTLLSNLLVQFMFKKINSKGLSRVTHLSLSKG